MKNGYYKREYDGNVTCHGIARSSTEVIPS